MTIGASRYEAWRDDPTDFRQQFELSHDDFCVVLRSLPADQLARYESILAVDDEAAIIFAVHKALDLGILRKD